MRSSRLLLTAALCAFTAGCNVAAQGTGAYSKPGDITVEAQVATAEMELNRQDPEGVLIAITPAARPGVLSTLSDQRRHQVLALDAYALAGAGHRGEAERVFSAIAAAPFADDDDALARLQNAIEYGDGAEADTALGPVLALGHPLHEMLSNDQIETLDTVLGASPNADAARFRLAEALDHEGWRIEGNSFDGQVIWLHYARALAAKGDPRALAIARRVDNPDLLMVMQADRRFDALVAADPVAFDPVASAQRRLAAAKVWVGQAPDYLYPRITLARTQAHLSQWRDAVATLDDAMDRAQAGQLRDGRPFYRLARIWQGALLFATGKPEDDIAIMRDISANCGCANDWMLRQARVRVSQRRPADAERLLDRLKGQDLTRPQRMVEAYLHACAAAQHGAPADAAPWLRTLEANRALDPDTFFNAEACATTPDHAAAVLISALGDPQMRAAALAALQQTDGSLVEPPGRRDLQRTFETLRHRPDVLAAVAAVGRVKRYPLQRMSYLS